MRRPRREDNEEKKKQFCSDGGENRKNEKK
jgi:hypothetical protein